MCSGGMVPYTEPAANPSPHMRAPQYHPRRMGSTEGSRAQVGGFGSGASSSSGASGWGGRTPRAIEPIVKRRLGSSDSFPDTAHSQTSGEVSGPVAPDTAGTGHGLESGTSDPEVSPTGDRISPSVRGLDTSDREKRRRHSIDPSMSHQGRDRQWVCSEWDIDT
jgi:hypothetical protein